MTDGDTTSPMDESALFCLRCSELLVPGQGDFYVVRIEAMADPTPPTITTDQLDQDLKPLIEKLLEQTRKMSEQELMDQVYRRMTIYLCRQCYAHWIENPAG